MKLSRRIVVTAGIFSATAGFSLAASAAEDSVVIAQGPASPAPVPAPDAGMSPSGRRGVGWYIGAGIGAGFNPKYKVNGRTITFDDRLRGATEEAGPIAMQFPNVGVTLGPNLLLGFSGSFVSQTGKLAGNDVRLQINNYMAAVTWFPVERGIFIRGGAGASNIQIEDGAFKDTVRGYGFLLGAGYALQLGRRHNITFTVDHSQQRYGASTTQPESSQFTAAYLGYMYRH